MSAEEQSHGIPDDIIVMTYAGAMAGLVVVLTGLALLVNFWMLQSTPDMVHHEPPAPVIQH